MEERDSWTVNILSAPSSASIESSHSSEQGHIWSEDYKTALDFPADLTVPVCDELPSDADDSSYPVLPLETPFAEKRTSEAPVTKTFDHQALTSMDIGLRLLQQAINESEGRFWHPEMSSVSYEASVSTDLSLGQAPSFLDDICERFCPPPFFFCED